MVNLHRTTVVFPPFSPNWHPKGEYQTKQARYLIRLACACHAAGVPYEIDWGHKSNHVYDGFGATLTIANVDRIPDAKPFPRWIESKVRDWKPRLLDAEYRLEAWTEATSNGQRWRPGFAIDHSSGLSLIRPSETGEWQDTPDDDRPVHSGWLVTHRLSGLGFGLDLNFKRAADALLLVAEAMDWTASAEALKMDLPKLRRARDLFQANFGKGWAKDNAKENLERAAQTA